MPPSYNIKGALVLKGQFFSTGMKSFVFVNLICCITIMIGLIHLYKVFLMPTIISTTVEMVVPPL